MSVVETSQSQLELRHQKLLSPSLITCQLLTQPRHCMLQASCLHSCLTPFAHLSFPTVVCLWRSSQCCCSFQHGYCLLQTSYPHWHSTLHACGLAIVPIPEGFLFSQWPWTSTSLSKPVNFFVSSELQPYILQLALNPNLGKGPLFKSVL